MNYVENLDELLELCEKLYSQLAHIEKNNEFEDEKNDIRQSLRKLIIAEAIQKKHIICVTGLQGVGKTSLMQNYYGIDFSKMNISEDLGTSIISIRYKIIFVGDVSVGKTSIMTRIVTNEFKDKYDVKIYNF